MEVMNALEELKERIERPRQFLGVTFGLNKEECVLLIRKVYASLPEELKEAQRIAQEGERILAAAKEEASHILERAKSESSRLVESSEKEAARVVEQAKIERDRMLAENEILKLAKAEAERIRGDAEAEAARLRRSADDYALDVLARLESVVSKALGSIERGKAEMQRPSAARPLKTQ